MNADRARQFLLGLPHVVESQQWNGLVFWVGDKAIGGKMFAFLHLDGLGHPIAYPATPERYTELLEREGMLPAPYLARIWWVAVERWDALREREWEDELRAGHLLVFAKLPLKVKALLALPRPELKRAVEAGTRRRAEREGAQRTKKAAKRNTRSPMCLE